MAAKTSIKKKEYREMRAVCQTKNLKDNFWKNLKKMDSTPVDKIPTVLIIDRDHTGTATIKQLLNEGDFRVYTANTLKDSHRFITMEKIDVALLVIRQSGDDPKQFITEL